MNKPANGQAAPTEPTPQILLEVLLEAVKELTELVAEIKDINVELLEKVSNLTIDNEGYSVED